VTPPYEGSRVLVLLGDPGMGKTVLLAEAAREARPAAMRVLAAARNWTCPPCCYGRTATWRGPVTISRICSPSCPGGPAPPPVADENSRPVENASLEVLQRLLCL
jgi:hypothetical protein